MSQLVALPRYTRLSSNVITILGMNPGKMTLQGTNTYLFGNSPSRLLVDTGEGNLEYRSNLTSVFYRENVRRISDIVLTHYHHDHIGGIEDVISALYHANLAREAALLFPCDNSTNASCSSPFSSSPSSSTLSLSSSVHALITSSLPSIWKDNSSHPLHSVHVTLPREPQSALLPLLEPLCPEAAQALYAASRVQSMGAVQTGNSDGVENVCNTTSASRMCTFDIPVRHIPDGAVFRYTAHSATSAEPLYQYHYDASATALTATPPHCTNHATGGPARPTSDAGDSLHGIHLLPGDLMVVSSPGHTSDHLGLLGRLTGPLQPHVRAAADTPIDVHLHVTAVAPAARAVGAAAGSQPLEPTVDPCNTTSTPLVLLSGDAILGSGSSALTDLHAYLHSLQRYRSLLLSAAHIHTDTRAVGDTASTSTASQQPARVLGESSPAPLCALFPAHGPAQADALAKVAEYEAHRQERCRQVEWALRHGGLQGYGAWVSSNGARASTEMEAHAPHTTHAPVQQSHAHFSTESTHLPSAVPSTPWMTVMDVVHAVYPTLRADLHMAAAQNTALVLDLLAQRGAVEVEDPRTDDAHCHAHASVRAGTSSTAAATAAADTQREPAAITERSHERDGCAACAETERNQYNPSFQEMVVRRKYRLVKHVYLPPNTNKL